MAIKRKSISDPKLVYYPNKILRTNCEKLPDSFFNTKTLNDLCLAMLSIAKHHDGVGLAAPQIGINARMVLIAPTPKKHFFLINPTIVTASERKILDSEGCLSLPEIFGTVIRHDRIVVQAYDQKGNPVEIEAKDIISRIIQHEIDHINGILFIDKALTITSGTEKLAKLQKMNNV